MKYLKNENNYDINLLAVNLVIAMFMQKLGTFASTETPLFRKTSSSKRKKMKGKKELHLPLSNLCGKNIHRDKNKYLNK